MDCILNAYPQALKNDVEVVVMFTDASSEADKWVYYEQNLGLQYMLADGQEIILPYRYSVEDNYEQIAHLLTSRQRKIYHTLYTRNSNGYIREKHLKLLLESDLEEWEYPFIFRLTTEYVASILIIIYEYLCANDNRGLKQFCELNINQLLLGQSRMVSYWNEFYRRCDKWYYCNVDNYPGHWNKLRHYPGQKLYKEYLGYKREMRKPSYVINAHR